MRTILWVRLSWECVTGRCSPSELPWKSRDLNLPDPSLALTTIPCWMERQSDRFLAKSGSGSTCMHRWCFPCFCPGNGGCTWEPIEKVTISFYKPSPPADGWAACPAPAGETMEELGAYAQGMLALFLKGTKFPKMEQWGHAGQTIDHFQRWSEAALFHLSFDEFKFKDLT